MLQSWLAISPLPPGYSGSLSMKHTNVRDPPSHATQIADLIIKTNGLKQETPEARITVALPFVHRSKME
jgi:hypothetical protein